MEMSREAILLPVASLSPRRAHFKDTFKIKDAAAFRTLRSQLELGRVGQLLTT